MPFGNIQMPSLACSLLKAELANQSISAGVGYYNLVFASTLGMLYLLCGSKSFLGEWVFSQLAFAPDARGNNKDGDRMEELLRGYEVPGGENDGSREIPEILAYELQDINLRPEDLSQRLIQARNEAEPFVESCTDDVAFVNPKILGFSIMSYQTCSSLALARRVKERMGAEAPLIVFGGSSCEGIMGYTLLRAYPWIDYVCCGEGDRAFPEFTKRFLEGDLHPRIEGILGREESNLTTPKPIIEMDDLPFPDFGDYFGLLHKLGMDSIATIPIETSRGCWWGEKSQCTFCGLNGSNLLYRRKNAERVLEEFEHLMRRYRCRKFKIIDNILDPSMFNSVFPELIRRRMNLRLFGETKSNLRSEQIRLLKAAGFEGIQPGVESLSDDTLRLMKKGVTGLQNIHLLRCCRELGLHAGWNWLWGFPQEKPIEYERMEQWIPLLHHLQPPGRFGRIHLDRFSPLFNSQKEFGICNVRPGLAYRLIFPLDGATLYDLASFFDYDYEDAREPSDYTAGLSEEILAWRSLWRDPARRPILAMLDLGGFIVIRDSRPCATARILTLKGLRARVYRYLTHIRQQSHLVAHFQELGFELEDTEQAMSYLEGKKLVLEDSGKCLGLACDALTMIRNRCN